jgi:serine/threonine protein kinase
VPVESGPSLISQGQEPGRGPDKSIFANRYRLEHQLGVGGMGTVFRAVDLVLGRQVALKALHSGLATEPLLVARFEKEARMLARLEHDNLVPIYAVDSHEGLPYFVMKLLEGDTFQHARRKRGKPFTVAEVTPMLEQLCAGLGFMHDKGVVHRDLKPGNLFLGTNGQVTILDLGVARDGVSSLTQPGAALGTPAYMSPEQTVTTELDARSDLYSLGVILYELVTGKQPYAGENEFELMRMHREGPIPDASMFGTSRGIAEVLTRALAKKPQDRYFKASDLLAAWKRAAADPLGAPPTGRMTPVPSPPANPAASTSTSQRRLKRVSDPNHPTPSPRTPKPVPSPGRLPPASAKPTTPPPSAPKPAPPPPPPPQARPIGLQDDADDDPVSAARTELSSEFLPLPTLDEPGTEAVDRATVIYTPHQPKERAKWPLLLAILVAMGIVGVVAVRELADDTSHGLPPDAPLAPKAEPAHPGPTPERPATDVAPPVEPHTAAQPAPAPEPEAAALAPAAPAPAPVVPTPAPVAPTPAPAPAAKAPAPAAKAPAPAVAAPAPAAPARVEAPAPKPAPKVEAVAPTPTPTHPPAPATESAHAADATQHPKAPPPPPHVKPGELRVVVVIGEKSTWGEVKVDGVAQGYAPATLQVAAGTHDVTVTRGSVNLLKKVKVQAGTTTVLKFEVPQ